MSHFPSHCYISWPLGRDRSQMYKILLTFVPAVVITEIPTFLFSFAWLSAAKIYIYDQIFLFYFICSEALVIFGSEKLATEMLWLYFGGHLNIVFIYWRFWLWLERTGWAPCSSLQVLLVPGLRASLLLSAFLMLLGAAVKSIPVADDHTKRW